MDEVHLERVVVDRAARAHARRSLARLAVALVATIVLATALTGWLTQATPVLRVPAVAWILCGEGRTPAFVRTLTVATPVSAMAVEGKRLACLDPRGGEPEGPNNLGMLKIWSVLALLIGAPLVWWARRRRGLTAGK